MRSGWKAAAAIGLFAALLSGCSGDEKKPSAPVTPSADSAALTALSHSADHLDTTSFAVDVVSGKSLNIKARMDSPKQLGELVMNAAAKEQTLKMVTRLIGSDVFVRIEGVQLPGVDARNWMKVDPSKISSGFQVGFAPGQNDPGGSSRMIKAINTAEALPDGRYKGTIDLTKAGTGTGLSFSSADISGLGAGASAVPFLASLDQQGRLTSLQLDLPAVTNGKAAFIDVTYSAFGQAFKVDTPPPAAVVTPPDSIYQFFGAK